VFVILIFSAKRVDWSRKMKGDLIDGVFMKVIPDISTSDVDCTPRNVNWFSMSSEPLIFNRDIII
jgi:hypothetical protein